MWVFEIITPGTWLASPDRDWSGKIENQLRALKSQFFEANAALNLFIEAQSTPPLLPDRATWERDSQRRSEIQRALEQERGGPVSFDEREVIRFEAEIRFKNEKWANGRVPREFRHALPFICARAFLYALDAFEKFLCVLSKEANVPAAIADLHARFEKEFPHLRGVRNSTQHLEDRARGLGGPQHNPKPLDLKPNSNSLVYSPNEGVLELNSLNGSRYGSTMSDGHYGEIDVSPESMRCVQRILEAVLQSFEWDGPRQHAPRA